MTTEAAIEIVMIEDNPRDAELALRVLRRFRLANRVEVLQDGAAALDYLLGDGDENDCALPRLILLDLKLPKVGGIEVLRRLKRDPRTRAIPTVVLTSSQEESDLQTCYRLGVNSYIVKPIRFEEFNQVVADLGLYWLLLNEPPLPPQGRNTGDRKPEQEDNA